MRKPIMRKPTIKAMAPRVRVQNWAVRDDSYGGAYTARTEDVPHLIFVWPYTLEGPHGNTPRFAAKMAVKEYVPGDDTAQPYMERETIADIQCYDQRNGKITVPAGPGGIARAVARWIKENG